MDDVTVESDAGRKLSILELLKKVSQRRQIILFSQEADVLAWAEANLGDPRNRLIRLEFGDGSGLARRRA
jgi:DNA repair protein SbcC/Rad50